MKILKHFIALSIVYFFIYLIRSYIFFEFINPFHWIIILPEQDYVYRIVFLIVVVFINIFAAFLKECIFWTTED